MIPGEQNRSLSDIFPAKPNYVNYLINWSVRQKIIYVETPKVGSTTIKQILQYAEFGFDMSKMPTDDHDHVHDRARSPLKSPRDNEAQFLHCLESTEYFTFSFVRNPFIRVLSAYLDKIVGRPGTTTRIQQQMGIDPSSYIPTFEEFVGIVYSQSIRDMNPHWAPQCFLLGIDRVRYDFLGRFEFFEDSIMQLITRTNLRIPEGAFGLGKGHATSADTRLRDNYTPQAIKRVQDIYSEDFKHLGYGWSL
jgi:Sulfotransferase family